MFAENLEQWMRLNKNTALPLHELNQTLTDIFTHTAQQHAEILSLYFGQLSDQFQRLSQIERSEELLNLQRDFASENVKASMDYLQKIITNTIANTHKLTQSMTDIVTHTSASQSMQNRQTEKAKSHK